MNPLEKSPAEINLKEMWSLFENSASISIKDLPKIQEKCTKALFKIQELKASREKWRLRAENAEAKLKSL